MIIELKSKNVFSKENCNVYSERMKPEVLQQAETNIGGNQARSLYQCGVEAQRAAAVWQKSMVADHRDDQQVQKFIVAEL
ncbi:MAG: hypothetical protein GY782_06620 [Gammaproteobacteria bacterium]|nr:hypothetical protein [Gammaproteobacteria bacterium]